MSIHSTSIAQRSSKKIHFDQKDTDYYLSWILGREIYDGSNREGRLAAAKCIPNADVESWYWEWSALAKRVWEQAELALEN